MCVNHLIETKSFSELAIGEAFSEIGSISTLYIKVEEVSQTPSKAERMKNDLPEVLHWNSIDLMTGQFYLFFPNSRIVPQPQAEVVY